MPRDERRLRARVSQRRDLGHLGRHALRIVKAPTTSPAASRGQVASDGEPCESSGRLCVWDGETGALSWSIQHAPQGLALNYNVFGLVDGALCFAAESAANGKAELWAVDL